MYIRRVTISDVRSISSLDWTLPAKQYAGWHVIIGDNGSGKSTFIRAIALTLVGLSEAAALRQNWNDWLRKDEDAGFIRLSLEADSRYDQVAERGKVPISPPSAAITLRREEDGSVIPLKGSSSFSPNRHVWSNKPGWFSASYGPYRRFSGGDKDFDKIFYSNPKLAPHLSAFGENIALTECIQWLKDLKFKSLESSGSSVLLEKIFSFVNQPGFLPHDTHLTDISSKGVHFIDGNDYDISVDDLSDGYRSVLSMTFELIRQMQIAYPRNDIFGSDGTRIIVPGVVLIDEVDAHLHPTWQRRIGSWFREHFPNLQFIVTTHSPFVCQAADIGTVYRLPKPGSGDKPSMVSGIDLERLIYGNVLDAYSTDLFGGGATRSEQSNKMLDRLAELNTAELRRMLTTTERRELKMLRSTLPTTAHKTRYPVVPK